MKQITLHNYASQLVTVFGDNAIIAICYMIASYNCKKIRESNEGAFPLLNLSGGPGTGKTQLARALTSVDRPGELGVNSNYIDMLPLRRYLASTKNSILHIDDYGDKARKEVDEILKGSFYGFAYRNEKGREQRVRSGIILSGINIPNIIFCNKTISLNFEKRIFNNDEMQEFSNLQQLLNHDLKHIIPEIERAFCIRHIDFDLAYRWTAIDLAFRIKKINYGAVINSWAQILAAYRILRHELNLPFSYEDVLKVARKAINSQIHSYEKSTMEITKQQLSDMKHAIGYKERSVINSKYRCFRNFFGVSGGSASWEELVALEYAEKAPSRFVEGEVVYRLTTVGMNYLQDTIGVTILPCED